MFDKIENLYQSMYQISYGYLIEQKRDNIKLIKKIIPQIQEFVLWFLEGNRFEIEEELYQEMQSYLLQVLEDITNAIAQEDRVLLHDAVAYGMMEYLKMFMDSKREGTEDVNI